MKNIAVVCGGNPGEFEISIGSAQTVLANLDKSEFNPFMIVIKNADWFYEKDGLRYVVDKNDFSITVDGRKIKFDGIFNAIHGTPGEDGKLQGYFDTLNLPYTSCNAATSALTFNKYFCNLFVNSYGIKTANSLSFTRDENISESEVIEKLGLPVFIKPVESGSSVGITKVKNKEDFQKAVETAFAICDRILIEEFIQGRELTCGIINKSKELIVLPLCEIVSKNEYFDYHAKYTEGMADEITPADFTEEVEQDAKALSSFLYRKMDCNGFVRFDYILTDEELYFIEVNTIPGISKASILPKMADAYGMSLSQLFSIAVNNMFD